MAAPSCPKTPSLLGQPRCLPPSLPAALPFIVHPIDGAVHAALNATLRPAMRRVVCQASGGKEAGLAICDCEDK